MAGGWPRPSPVLASPVELFSSWGRKYDAFSFFSLPRGEADLCSFVIFGLVHILDRKYGLSFLRSSRRDTVHRTRCFFFLFRFLGDGKMTKSPLNAVTCVHYMYLRRSGIRVQNVVWLAYDLVLCLFGNYFFGVLSVYSVVRIRSCERFTDGSSVCSTKVPEERTRMAGSWGLFFYIYLLW